MKRLQHIWDFIRFIARRFEQDRCTQVASSLTFTTLLSLVPMVTIALTMVSAFPIFEEFGAQIKNFLLANMMPETAGKLISQYMEQFTTSASELTTFGIIFLGVTAMLMMLTIDNAFNMIWRVSRPRTLLVRISTYGAVIIFTPLLLGASLTLTSWLVGVPDSNLISKLGVTLIKVVPVLLATLAFTLLFKIVPNRYVPLSHALVGGAVAAITFEYMNHSFAIYIANFTTYELVYGAFASIPIFLLWIYFSWLTVLVGALISASLSHWRGSQLKYDSPVTQLYFALRILKLMDKGFREGTVQNLNALSNKLNMGFDLIEHILDKLSQIKVVRKISRQSWAVVRDVGQVQANELYRLFVFDPTDLSIAEEEEEINGWLSELGQENTGLKNVSLRDLFGVVKESAV